MFCTHLDVCTEQETPTTVKQTSKRSAYSTYVMTRCDVSLNERQEALAGDVYETGLRRTVGGMKHEHTGSRTVGQDTSMCATA